MLNRILSLARVIRTKVAVFGKKHYLKYGVGLHVGKNSRLWAPSRLIIGKNVYIGKNVHIECDCEIGDYCLIANQVAFVGKHDHDFRAVGYPVRFSPWAGSHKLDSGSANEKIIVGQDVWIGYGAILLTGITVGKGAIISAGSLVVKDVEPYSIVGGVPVKTLGSRFTETEIKIHEKKIISGEFVFSERGYDFCKIEPGVISDDA